MSISLHELLAVARESEAVKAVQGDDVLCKKRFAPDTRYTVEFLVVGAKGMVRRKGRVSSLFLDKGSVS
ncbi:hypothetical protein DEGADCKI_00703 [[Clostridium] scindens]|nr:DUF5720 family protein [[Clostridium] scindens]WPB39402.1 hypothetical protein DEGADCKI_00703 [[Clostridium] scindens]